jgi:hypothetical protein
VNPAGVKSDAVVSNDEEETEQPSWDPVWDAAVRRDSAGWTAELRIPLSELRYSATSADGTQTWGVQFGRDIARHRERSLWAPVSAGDHGYVSRFGELQGLDVRPVRRVEIVPYVLGRLTREPAQTADPFADPSRVVIAAGADVRAGLSADLTLTATLNPDFGQVEADPSEVNLTGTETFLAEPRRFFVEGADLFRTGMADAEWMHGPEEVFYSRRIGRAVQGSPPDDARFADYSPAARIHGAAKLSGKTGGWAVGTLAALTAAEQARFVGPGGNVDRAVMEPLTSYTVTRITRESEGGRAAYGGVLTTTHRRLEGGSLLPATAYVAGADGRLRFGRSAGWDLRGSIVASHLRGDSAAIDRIRRNAVHRHQRPDAHHIGYAPGATTLSGYSLTGSIAKNDGQWRGSVNAHLVSPGFDANDLGYHTASDLARIHLLLGYRQMEPGRFRRWWGWLNAWSAWTGGGEQTALALQLNGNVELHSQWLFATSLRREASVLSPTVLRGGPALRLPGRTRLAVAVTGDRRRAMSYGAGASLLQGDEGERVLRLAPQVTMRPSARLDVMLEPSIQWTDHPSQWIAQGTDDSEPVHLVGALAQTTAALTVRANLAFTRDLSLQVYAQPFASDGRFTAFAEVAEPRAGSDRHRFRPVSASRDAADAGRLAIDRDGDGEAELTVGNPAFDVDEATVNAVLRWEARPGSTFFLVWTHERPGRLTDGTRNVLLAKASVAISR